MEEKFSRQKSWYQIFIIHLPAATILHARSHWGGGVSRALPLRKEPKIISTWQQLNTVHCQLNVSKSPNLVHRGYFSFRLEVRPFVLFWSFWSPNILNTSLLFIFIQFSGLQVTSYSSSILFSWLQYYWELLPRSRFKPQTQSIYPVERKFSWTGFDTEIKIII